jgi:hypothetical protein
MVEIFELRRKTNVAPRRLAPSPRRTQDGHFIPSMETVELVSDAMIAKDGTHELLAAKLHGQIEFSEALGELLTVVIANDALRFWATNAGQKRGNYELANAGGFTREFSRSLIKALPGLSIIPPRVTRPLYSELSMFLRSGGSMGGSWGDVVLEQSDIVVKARKKKPLDAD